MRCAEGTVGGGDGAGRAAPSTSPDDLWRVSSGWQLRGEQERCHVVHGEVPAREAGGPAACSDPRARTVESATPERLLGQGSLPVAKALGLQDQLQEVQGQGGHRHPPHLLSHLLLSPSPTSPCPPPPGPLQHLQHLSSAEPSPALRSGRHASHHRLVSVSGSKPRAFLSLESPV